MTTLLERREDAEKQAQQQQADAEPTPRAAGAAMLAAASRIARQKGVTLPEHFERSSFEQVRALIAQWNELPDAAGDETQEEPPF